MTGSIGEKPFSVNLYKRGGQNARAWIQTLDRNDGTYVVRYKLFESVQDLTIDIFYNNDRVGQSPYVLKGLNSLTSV